MKTIRSIKDMRKAVRGFKKHGRLIGFVPTMGALHDGHLSLIKQARRESDSVIVSIFVNPTQFSPQEDFKKYPRNLRVDSLLCKKEGVDIIFYPDNPIIYMCL